MLNADATHNLLICFMWVLKNADYAVLKSWWSELPLTRLSRIVEIVYFVVSNFEYKVNMFLFFLLVALHIFLTPLIIIISFKFIFK